MRRQPRTAPPPRPFGQLRAALSRVERRQGRQAVARSASSAWGWGPKRNKKKMATTMTRTFMLVLSGLLTTALLSAQSGSDWMKAPTDSWPTYNGDYTGRRFSPLTKITAQNVDQLSLGWSYRVNLGPNSGGLG